MSVSAALAAIVLSWLLVEPPGWAAARLAGLPADRFTRVWMGLALTSIVGLALARAGWFSLPVLLAIFGALTVAGIAAGRGATSAAPAARPPRGCTLAAALAALAVLAWSLPPYDTTLAAADSTMYVSAGIHLARSGSITVPDTVVPLLPHAAASALFTSLGWLNAGPFVRLPGGLLMATLEAPRAIPAFFPLLPVWTGILALGGGPAAAVLAAPLFTALGVWAVVLFAGETLGLAAALGSGAVLVANFAVWWFARFPMPEPLALAAFWAGLTLLHRAGVAADRRLGVLAGVVLGLTGLARTESFLFLAAAVALAWAWPRRTITVAPLLAGLALVAAVALLNGESSPSHHLTYLRNDLALQYGAAYLRASQSGLLGTLRVAAVGAALIATLLLVVAALWGRRAGIGGLRGMLRLAAPLALLAVLALYVRVGLNVLPWRDVSWLAAYCSWPLLVLAAGGAPLAWRRGDFAIRVGAWACGIATVVFVLNPRVSAYQPWAIRRFLPLVIPGIAVAGGAALAWIAARPRPRARLLAVAAAALVVALESWPVLGVRAQPYYGGNLAAVEALAARLPSDALVAIDSELADVQLQVPLWLVTGRETLMLSQGGQRWRDVMRGLLGSGRPVMWISNGHEPPRNTGDIAVEALAPDPDLTILAPDAPSDTPPARKVTRLVPLRLYAVALTASSSGSAIAPAAPPDRAPSAWHTAPG